MDVFHFKDDGARYKANLALPQNLIYEPHFLSPHFMNFAWMQLSQEKKLKLLKLLPSLSSDGSDLAFQSETLKKLIEGDTFKFGNPVKMLKDDLTSGKHTDRYYIKKSIIEKYNSRKRKLQHVSQCFANLSELKDKLANHHISHEARRLSRHASRKIKIMNVDERVGKRHITELRRIRLEVREKGDSSDDEDLIQELMTERDRKMSRLRSLQDWSNPMMNKAAKSVKEDDILKEDTTCLPDLPALEDISKPLHHHSMEERHMTSVEEPENNFFSLLRYFLCQTDNHSLTIPDLMEAIRQWESSANRQLVTWIGNSDSWVNEIPSAIAFLCGAFPNAQPPGFSPTVACDSTSGLYTWIDQDNTGQLSQLKTWWFERRAICQAVTTGGSSTKTEEVSQAILDFRAQERVRQLDQSQMPFVYTLAGRSVQVEPVQPPPQAYFSDPVMQNLMTHHNVTFYALIQDALHRLQNGRGSLEDITNLIKESQFLNPKADNTTLMQKVAMALTHFQKGQSHPVVMFDPSNKQYVVKPHGQPQQPAAVAPQRNVSHLVQVRTPQGMKLYRLASSVQANPASGGRIIVASNPRPPVSVMQPAPTRLHQADDTVIVRNSDGRLVQMPRSMLKKLINSGQLKSPQQPQLQQPTQPQLQQPTQPQLQQPTQPQPRPAVPMMENVLSLLPTVPVGQDQLHHNPQ